MIDIASACKHAIGAPAAPDAGDKLPDVMSLALLSLTNVSAHC